MWHTWMVEILYEQSKPHEHSLRTIKPTTKGTYLME